MTDTTQPREQAAPDSNNPDKLAALLCCLYEGPEIQLAATMLIEQAMELEELRAIPVAAPEAPTNEVLEELWETTHYGHPADFAADVLQRWGGWQDGLLGYGGALNAKVAATGAAPEAPTGKAEFMAHIKQTADIVATWPAWKQTMYANSAATTASASGVPLPEGWAKAGERIVMHNFPGMITNCIAAATAEKRKEFIAALLAGIEYEIDAARRATAPSRNAAPLDENAVKKWLAENIDSYFSYAPDYGSDIMWTSVDDIQLFLRAALTQQSAAQALPPPELTWLYTHCKAIGMNCKSDSGKWEHDIALFTTNLVDAAQAAHAGADTARMDYIERKAVRGGSYQHITSIDVIVHSGDLAKGVRYAIDRMKERDMAATEKKEQS